jgi:hypothetical protein
MGGVVRATVRAVSSFGAAFALGACGLVMSFDDYKSGAEGFRILGTVEGLDDGARVTLTLNGTERIEVGNGPYEFTVRVPNGAPYLVAASAALHACKNAEGSVAGADVHAIVACASDDHELVELRVADGTFAHSVPPPIVPGAVHRVGFPFLAPTASVFARARSPTATVRIGGTVIPPQSGVMAGVTVEAQPRPKPVDVEVTSASGRRAVHHIVLDTTVDHLLASNARAEAQFGLAVAVSGDTLAIGSPGEPSNATGIDGNQANTSAAYAGAVYVFKRSGGTWAPQAYIKPSNTRAFFYFGSALALDGDTLVVGAQGEDSNARGVNQNQANTSATNAGAAYVFTRSGATWSQQAYIKASNTASGNEFGYAVALAGDTLVVGSPYEDSGATGIDGNQNDTSAMWAGSAYVFTRSGTTWSQAAYVKASNTRDRAFFGCSVAISGNTAVVGSFGERGAATGVNQSQADGGLMNAGAAYVFTRSGSTWSQQAYVKSSNTRAGPRFGNAVSISGDTAAVGAREENSGATGVNGNQADTSAAGAGAVYVFARTGTAWSQEAYVKAANTRADAWFGNAVSLAGDVLVVGSPRESINATGLNGNPLDASAQYSGAAYAFTRTSGAWIQRVYVKGKETRPNGAVGHSVALQGGTLAVGAPSEITANHGLAGEAYVLPLH